jgi:hypothetical protein
MRVIIPQAITGALLASSDATEVAPADYVAGTTYAAGATVSVSGAKGLKTVYESLQGGNVGHTPASSPTWWVNRGDTYQSYSAGATYALGDRVIDPTSHKVYESVVASNTGQALTDTTKWLYVSYTNKWAMFDYTKSTATSRPGSLSWSITTGKRVEAVSLHGLAGKTLTVTVVVAGVTVYTDTLTLTKRNTIGWKTYCFGAFSTQETYARFNLPPYYNATVTFTVAAATASTIAKCRACVVGTQEYLGAVQYEAESDVLNFSTVDRDFEGNTSTMVPRRNVPKTIQQIWLDKKLVNRARKLRDQLNGIPAVWSALDDANTDGYFETLIILGFYKRFTINTKAPQVAVIGLELEEI